MQSLEHGAPDRLQVIGRQVQLRRRRRPLEGTVLDLRNLVIAQVAAVGEEPQCHWSQSLHFYFQEMKNCKEVNGQLQTSVNLHFLEVCQASEGPSGLQHREVVVVEAPEGDKSVQCVCRVVCVCMCV